MGLTTRTTRDDPGRPGRTGPPRGEDTGVLVSSAGDGARAWEAAVMTALLEQECELTALGGGTYERDLSKVWWGFEAQHGGYVLALAKTAMQAELGVDGMEPQHLTVQYLKPFVDGPFRAEVTVERRGRTMANAIARLWSGGRLAGIALGSFAHRRALHEFTTLTAPDASPPATTEAGERPEVPVPTYDKVWVHPRIEELDGPGPARVGGWVVPRTPEVIDHRWIGLLADLWPPVLYSYWDRPAVAQTVDLTYHSRASLPRADLPPGTPLLVVLTTRASAGGLVDEDSEIWSPSGELLGQGRQVRFLHG